MPLRQDLHTHSSFDDGKSTLKEMAEGALRAGLTSVGFSLHSPLPYENEWAPTEETVPVFIEEAKRVQRDMEDRLRVYIGIEYDGASTLALEGFDYVIGSLHHVNCGGVLRPVDESAAVNREIVAFFGSPDRAAEAYFAQYDALADNREVDIIGHFDLLTKFNEQDPLFDPASPAYLAAARRAMKKLVDAGKIFEINTGAISRGYRTTPYPAGNLLQMLRELGGKVTLNSDSHHEDTLAFNFNDTAEIVKQYGFAEIWRFDGEKFVPLPL